MERILTPDYVPTGSAALRDGQQIRPYQWQASRHCAWLMMMPPRNE